jgi:hypothetical protein
LCEGGVLVLEELCDALCVEPLGRHALPEKVHHERRGQWNQRAGLESKRFVNRAGHCAASGTERIWLRAPGESTGTERPQDPAQTAHRRHSGVLRQHLHDPIEAPGARRLTRQGSGHQRTDDRNPFGHEIGVQADGLTHLTGDVRR